MEMNKDTHEMVEKERKKQRQSEKFALEDERAKVLKKKRREVNKELKRIY